MRRPQIIRSSIISSLQQKKLQLITSTFDRAKLHNDIILKPLVKQFAENRYKTLLEDIRTFLNIQTLEIVQMNDILSFATRLFTVIDNDIEVLVKNQQVRQDSVTNQIRIAQLQKQLSSLKSQLISSADQIRSFDQMLEFTGGVFAAYNRRLNQCKDIYDQMSKVQICTTLAIDASYDVNVNQDYYQKYYTQLLEVLIRMKKSLKSLADEIKSASSVDMPLRCHNFLVNCRNLVLQLESFLVDKNCVFNRLLCYVITIHQKNLKELFQIATNKGKISISIYEVIQKNFYMFRIFDQQILKLEEQIDRLGRQIQKQFKNKNYTEVDKIYRYSIKQVANEYFTLKQIKAHISEIDEEFLKYVTRLQFNVKMKRVKDAKVRVKEFEEYIKSINKLGENDNFLKQKQIELRHQGEKLSRTLSNYINKIEPFTEEIFKNIYKQIQQRLIEISNLQETLISSNTTQISQLKSIFINEKLTHLKSLQESYFRIEKRLLGLIQQSKKSYEQSSQRNFDNADETLAKCKSFLENLDPSIEGDIGKWQKKYIDRQTKFLQVITKAQSKIYQQKGLFQDAESLNKKKQTLAQLAKMKVNFEALMRMYDSAVFSGSLSGIVSQLSFEFRQQVKKQLQQNRQYMDELMDYYKQVRQNETPDIKSQLLPKVQQATKQRLQVMSEVIATYSCLFQVYEKLKSNQEPEQLRNKYVPIGNQKVLSYLTLVYLSRKQLSNRIRQIQQNQKIQQKTKQFLEIKISDVLSPLEVKTTMEELQKYVVLLGRGMQFAPNVQQIIGDLLRKANNPKDEFYRKRIVAVCEQLNDLKKDMKSLEAFEEGPLGKITFGNIKAQMKKLQEYFMLAEQVVQEKNMHKMSLNVELKDQKVKGVKNKILLNSDV